MSEPNAEEAARAEGWVPQSEWKGDAAKWIDAEAFVKRGEEILPIVNAKNRKLNEEVAGLRREIEDLKLGSSQFRDFHEQSLAKERQQREQAIRELEDARKKAVTAGDGEAFDRADRQIVQLRTQPAPVPKLNDGQRAWLTENQWYNSDRVLRALADGLSDGLAAEKPELVGRKEFLDELTKRVKAEMPHKFENLNRQRTVVEDTQQRGGGAGNGKAKTYENLPSDAKTACDRFVRTIPGYTKEKYVAAYAWE